MNNSIYPNYSTPCVPGYSDECGGKTWDGGSGREEGRWRRSQGGTASRPHVPRFPRDLGCPCGRSTGCRTLTGNTLLSSFLCYVLLLIKFLHTGQPLRFSSLLCYNCSSFLEFLYTFYLFFLFFNFFLFLDSDLAPPGCISMTLQLFIFLQSKTGQLAGVWAEKASPVVSSWLQSVSTRSALAP